MFLGKGGICYFMETRIVLHPQLCTDKEVRVKKGRRGEGGGKGRRREGGGREEKGREGL